MLFNTFYKKGQKGYELNQDILTYYCKSGSVKATGKYINIILESEWIFYRKNVPLQETGNFMNGLKDCFWIYYINQFEDREQFIQN